MASRKQSRRMPIVRASHCGWNQSVTVTWRSSLLRGASLRRWKLPLHSAWRTERRLSVFARRSGMVA